MLSIIIPVYNQHEMTEECVLSIRENTQDYELILVDNGSTPEIKKPYADQHDVTVIRNKKNMGFPAAVNQGICAAKGEIICLLNNDVIVTPGWAERLTSWLDDFSIVGPCTNYAAGIQGVTVGNYTSRSGLDEEAEKLSDQDMAEDVNFVIGFCMFFKKSLLDEIGEFDESLWPCSGEEIDFCFRAVERGHKIGVAYDVYIHHFGSQTFQQMESNGQLIYTDVCKMCDEHLAERWGKDFWQQQIIERPHDEIIA